MCLTFPNNIGSVEYDLHIFSILGIFFLQTLLLLAIFWHEMCVFMQKMAKSNEKYKISSNFEQLYLRDKISYKDVRRGILKVRTNMF